MNLGKTGLSNWRRQRIRIGFVLVGLLITLGITLPQPALPVSAPTQLAQLSDAEESLRQGTAAYTNQQFALAIEQWQIALMGFEAEANGLRQALVLSNLSLAHQQLGQWPEARTAVERSLQLLQTQATQPDAIYQAVLAKALNAQGRLQWYQGSLEAALTSWQQASQHYKQANDRTGLVISLINQSRALQALGFNVRAETQLQQVEALLQQEPDANLQASGLRSLGNALRQVGKLPESRQILETSLQIQPLAAGVESAIWLDLGNTERALGQRALAIGNQNLAQQQFQAAQIAYQQAGVRADGPLTSLQAQLNLLSLLIEMQQVPAAVQLAEALPDQWNQLPLSHPRLSAQLNYTHSLLKLNQAGALNQAQKQQLTKFLTTTLQQSRELADLTVESFALGQLGELSEQQQQWSEAQRWTQQALLQAESLQSPALRYRWEWQLGRLQQQQGNLQDALIAYQAAVESLQSVRNDLLAISADVQFSFRDDVEPVYRGLVELLLTVDGKTPSQANLKRAIQEVNALQLAELNNFLGCNLAQVVDLASVDTDATAAKVYPMILPNQLAVVLEVPNQPLRYQEVIQPQAAVLSLLQQLRQDLNAADRTPEAIAGLQQLHRWLIAPFASSLPDTIKTLVFVLDGELRNIPMAALYDGENYLISQYAVAVAPRLELFQPSPRSAQLNVFLGGVGEPQTLDNRAFPEIEYLDAELNEIQTLVQAQQPLLNQAFTEPNLEKSLQSGFSVVHLKTHGIFSSDPDETFIVAYQSLITGRELGRLIQLQRLGEASPVELLVLSACSTAQGDQRAVLGLAGIAVQAGARSVVSTLWEAQDLPNTQLMIRFYQELLKPQTSRAEALRAAQLHLLELGYATPHIWATYVLVGNWL
jgi:CHAT domain-containing protein